MYNILPVFRSDYFTRGKLLCPRPPEPSHQGRHHRRRGAHRVDGEPGSKAPQMGLSVEDGHLQ